MGRKMDIAFTSSLVFLVMFILLSMTDKDIRLIGVMAALSGVCAGIVVSRITKRKMGYREKRKSARRFSKSLIYMEADEALKRMFEILKDRYHLKEYGFSDECLLFTEEADEEMCALVVIRKFKSAPDDFLNHWRKIRKTTNAKKIVFAVCGKLDSDARSLTLKLKDPKIRLLDASDIRLIYLKSGKKQAQEAPGARVSPLYALRMYISKKRAVRCMLYALLMIFYYLLTGFYAYIVVGGVMMLISIIGMSSFSASEKLF